MVFGDFGSRIFAAKSLPFFFFFSLHAEQRKFVSINAECLSNTEV